MGDRLLASWAADTEGQCSIGTAVLSHTSETSTATASLYGFEAVPERVANQAADQDYQDERGEALEPYSPLTPPGADLYT